MRATTAERPAGSRRMLLGFRVDRWDLRRSRCEPQAPTRNAQPASCKAAHGQSAGWAGKALCGWRPRDLSWKLPWEAEVEGSLGSGLVLPSCQAPSLVTEVTGHRPPASTHMCTSAHTEGKGRHYKDGVSTCVLRRSGGRLFPPPADAGADQFLTRGE